MGRVGAFEAESWREGRERDGMDPKYRGYVGYVYFDIPTNSVLASLRVDGSMTKRLTRSRYEAILTPILSRGKAFKIFLADLSSRVKKDAE